MTKSTVLTLVTCIWVCLSVVKAEASPYCVDAERSRFSIQVGSGGLFAAFGHDHEIAAKDIQGCADIDWSQIERSSVNLNFAAAGITVLDPKHPKDRAEVQDTMEKQVLKVAEFPQIHFESARVRVKQPVTGTNRYELVLDGPLTIRGHTEQVSIPVVLTREASAGARVSGRYALKQTTFGIKPISLAGGTVKVKDEIRIEFDLQLRESR